MMLVERYIRHTRTSRGGVTTDVRLPLPFARAYQHYSSSALPRVTGVVTAPLVTETGVLTTNGLNRELELVFRIDRALCRLVPKPGRVSDEDAQAAYRFLAEEWLCDVLTNDEGKAIIIVAALTAIERLLLQERPAFVITAGQAGGGKTTVANMISLAVNGRLGSKATWSEHEEERRKAIFAHLREGPAMITWDNLKRGTAISCPTLEKSLTSPEITDRVLGQSAQVSVPTTSVHIFTGNNITPVRDMASRTFVIRLNVDRPDPENRKFKHPDPLAWTLENRARILEALYKLLAWNPVLQLAPSERSPAKTRFKRWWTLCGAPVEKVAGVDFGKIMQARDNEDAEASGIATLLQCLEETFHDEEFTAEEVAEVARNFEPKAPCPIEATLEEATARPFPRSTVLDGQKVGKRLQMIVGRPVLVGDRVLTLQRTANRKTAHHYSIAVAA